MRAGLHIVLLSLLSAFAAESLARDADLATLEDKARAGDVLAQVELASRYDFGTGIRRNPRRAERWYRAAAEAGNADAQNSLGSMLQERRKFDEARVWYEKAAAQAHEQGTNNIGYLFDLGLGTAQDRERVNVCLVEVVQFVQLFRDDDHRDARCYCAGDWRRPGASDLGTQEDDEDQGRSLHDCTSTCFSGATCRESTSRRSCAA